MYLFHCCEKLLHQFHYLSTNKKIQSMFHCVFLSLNYGVSNFFGEWIQKSKQSNVKDKDAIKEAA